jgi:hypothetical protein
VSSYYVDLALALADAPTTAEVRIESSCTVTSADGGSCRFPAGPDLGRVLLELLDSQISSLDANELDLILEFTGGHRIQVHAEVTGYESYSVSTNGDVAVALKPWL